MFSSALGLRAAIDLAGLAVAGGLFIVPAFAAVQAWSGADYRARTIAAVNVLNAAFMTGATVVVALLQKFGVTVPMLFCADRRGDARRRGRDLADDAESRASLFPHLQTRSTISPATPR